MAELTPLLPVHLNYCSSELCLESQIPAAFHDDAGAVSRRVYELAFPSSALGELGFNLFQRFGKSRPEKIMADFAYGFLFRQP